MKLPSVEAVGYRMLALAGAITRAQVELQLCRDDSEETHVVTVHRELQQWLDDEGIRSHLSNYERSLMDLKTGAWPQEDLFGILSQTEALVALLWALNRIDALPPYTAHTNAAWVFSHIPLRQPCRPLLSALAFRSGETIAAERDAAEFWNWRARTEQQRRDGLEPPPDETYEDVIRSATEYTHCHHLISEVGDGDVLVSGQPYTAISQELLDSLATIAYERHYALNWLCGATPTYDWDKVPTAT